MDALALSLHVFNLLAPAWGLGFLLALALTWRGRPAGAPRLRALWGHALWLAGAGSAVLIAGLVLEGRDGRMATYAALVGVLGAVAAWRDGVWRR